MKHYYARYDCTVSRSNPGHGFANSKWIKIFRTAKQRDIFLKRRKYWDFSAESVKRKDLTTEEYQGAVLMYVMECDGKMSEFSSDDPALYTTTGTSKIGL